MRRKLTVIAVLALALALIATGSWAYFVDQTEAENIVKTGTITIEVNEYSLDGDGLRVEYPAEPITGVMPGTSTPKIVEVVNTGSGDAWMRVRLTVTITAEDGSPLANAFTPEGESREEYMAALVLPDVTTPTLPFIAEGGWLYFKEAVAPGAYIHVLDAVRFHKDMPNEYQNCTVTVYIEAEAVQAANNPIPDGGDVTDVAGWANP